MSEKQVSKTEQFKGHLQKVVKQSLGVKVSKETAWNLFKDVINSTVEFTLNAKGVSAKDSKGNDIIKGENVLPLAGIGNFEILKTAPRKSKAGYKEVKVEVDGKETKKLVKDDTLKVWPFVPRFRFYPSVAIDRVVEKYFDLGDHEDLELKHYGDFASQEEIDAKYNELNLKKEKPAKSVKKDESIESDIATSNPSEEISEPINTEKVDLDDLDIDL